MRTLIDIPGKAIEALGAICASKKLSRAEAVRQAIASYIASHRADSHKAFGLWKNRGKRDGLAYQKKVRAEW